MKIGSSWRNIPAGQRRVGQALVLFLVLMLGFTLLSRALDAFTIARVSVGTPSYGALTSEVVLQGETVAAGERAVTFPAGFPVRELYLQEGQRVAAGDAVAVLDIAEIDRQLTAARRSLEEARLAAAVQAVRAEQVQNDPLEEAELALERAEQDAAAAKEAAGFAVSRAESALREAQRERSRLYEEGDYTDAELADVQSRINERGYDVEEAIRQAEEQEVKSQRVIEDAARAIEDAARAQKEKDNQSAAADQTRRLEQGRSGLQIAEKQTLVAELETLREEEGVVTAPQGGIVTALSLEPGDVTGAGGAFLLAGQSGARFDAPASKAEAARLSEGMRVEVLLTGRKEPAAAVIAAVKPPGEVGGDYLVTAELDDSDIPPGTAGTLTAVERAAAETALVPLSSLHMENSQQMGYVFLLRERQSTMGTVQTVERCNLQILDRGKSMAAVQAPFALDDRIVIASSRPLLDGDRVRQEVAE